MLTRRDWLSLTASAALARIARPVAAVAAEREDRIRGIVAAYSAQGIHRTATAVDNASGNWLRDEVARTGLTPALETFTIDRVDPVAANITAGDRRIDGLPMFDAAFTDAAGIHGRLTTPDGGGDVAVFEAAPNSAGAGPLGDARRSGRFKALVCVTTGGRPGLCPNNADSFLEPFGPPVLQVGSDAGDWLKSLAARGADVHLVASVARTRADAVNVVARIAGADSSLPPLVVMTPRSGWYTCASERAGGIACWLELMRVLRTSTARQDVVFVASSGHELGHLGINAFVQKRPGIVKNSVGWIHMGANIGAATDPRNTIQSSDDELEAMLAASLTKSGLSVDTRVRRGTVPGGEAEVVHRGGGRYVSIIGRNLLFHNPDDRGAETVDAAKPATFADAFSRVASSLIA